MINLASIIEKELSSKSKDDILITGGVGNIIPTEIFGTLIISEKLADILEIYPDWKMDKVFTEEPCILFSDNLKTGEISISIIVGSRSSCEMDAYFEKEIVDLFKNKIKELYTRNNSSIVNFYN